MRPQHITAENVRPPRLHLQAHHASMRPQHITAENAAAPTIITPPAPGFNEAAAYHCGKRLGDSVVRRRRQASMRPQHITAENRPSGSEKQTQKSFNEAAAYHCGKRPARRTRRVVQLSFNEAAAYHCGKRSRPAGLAGGGLASMRPQHITAENEIHRRPERVPADASMRPQHITAENPGPGRGALRGALRFNEAAAYHCGKLLIIVASSRARAGFNEAAAYHCGKLRSAGPESETLSPLQ